jgi:hypothetical protein
MFGFLCGFFLLGRQPGLDTDGKGHYNRRSAIDSA